MGEGPLRTPAYLRGCWVTFFTVGAALRVGLRAPSPRRGAGWRGVAPAPPLGSCVGWGGPSGRPPAALAARRIAVWRGVAQGAALGVLGVGAALWVGLRPSRRAVAQCGGGWHRCRPWGPWAFCIGVFAGLLYRYRFCTVFVRLFDGCLSVLVRLLFGFYMFVVLFWNGFCWIGAGQRYTATGEPSLTHSLTQTPLTHSNSLTARVLALRARGLEESSGPIYLRFQGWGGR